MTRISDLDTVLIGLGGNLPSAFGEPRQTLEAALARLEKGGLRILAKSSWWISAPVPVSDQPWYVNGVIAAENGFAPAELLALLQEVEHEFGRRRNIRNEARTLDLDILAIGRSIVETADLVVPHPRLSERAFVLLPLREIAPDWRHPATGDTLSDLIARLPAEQAIEPLDQ